MDNTNVCAEIWPCVLKYGHAIHDTMDVHLTRNYQLFLFIYTDFLSWSFINFYF